MKLALHQASIPFIFKMQEAELKACGSLKCPLGQTYRAMLSAHRVGVQMKILIPFKTSRQFKPGSAKQNGFLVPLQQQLMPLNGKYINYKDLYYYAKHN